MISHKGERVVETPKEMALKALTESGEFTESQREAIANAVDLAIKRWGWIVSEIVTKKIGGEEIDLRALGIDKDKI
jgi:hypothetical protein